MHLLNGCPSKSLPVYRSDTVLTSKVVGGSRAASEVHSRTIAHSHFHCCWSLDINAAVHFGVTRFTSKCNSVFRIVYSQFWAGQTQTRIQDLCISFKLLWNKVAAFANNFVKILSPYCTSTAQMEQTQLHPIVKFGHTVRSMEGSAGSVFGSYMKKCLATKMSDCLLCECADSWVDLIELN